MSKARMAYSCKIYLKEECDGCGLCQVRDAPGLPRMQAGPFACGEMDDPFAPDVMDVDGER